MKYSRRVTAYLLYWALLQVTTVPDEGENSFKMPRASVVHMTSTATRPQHMSQVSITVLLRAYYYYYYYSNRTRIDSSLFLSYLFFFYLLHLVRRREGEIRKKRRRGIEIIVGGQGDVIGVPISPIYISPRLLEIIQIH